MFTGLGSFSQSLIQLVGFGIEHQVADHLPHAQPRQRHNQVGQNRAEESAHTDQQAIKTTQKRRIEFIGHGLKRLGRYFVIFWAHNAVDKVHGESNTVFITKQVS